MDAVVFFKPQLVRFFEDLRSERQPMEVVANRLSLRWYLGYDLHEPLPDHSSLTRIRERFGLAIFRRIFERLQRSSYRPGPEQFAGRYGGLFSSSDHVDSP